MKKLLLLAVTAAMSFHVARAQVHEQGNILFDAYYGFPNMATGLLRGVTNPANIAGGDLKVKSFGPAGARVEFLLTDRFGMGVNFSYANSALEWDEVFTEMQNGQFVDVVYNIKLSYPRYRIMGTWNLHLGDNDKLDPYIGGGIGYANARFKLESDHPDFDEDEFENAIRLRLPLAWRIFEFGMRYYFTDNIGFNWNVGLGAGPLIGLGLSAKL